MRWEMDLLLLSRDQKTEFSVEACWLSQSKSTHKLLMILFFLKALAWSTYTGFPQDRQSTRILFWGFKGFQQEIRSEEASTLQVVISPMTMHQSTTPSLSQTIWPRWVSRQFLNLPIFQNLLPVTFGYSLSSEDVVMRQFRRWKRLWRRSLTRSHFHGAFQKLLERYNKCIAARGNYFEGD